MAGLAIFIETVIAVSDSNDLLHAPAIVADSFGSPATIGRLFLTDHLLAFEAISLILLVGAIAGVVLGAGDLLPASATRRGPASASRRASASTCAASCSAASATSRSSESEVGA